MNGNLKPASDHCEDVFDRVVRLANPPLFNPDSVVLAAVSGGSDSMAMLHLLSNLRDQGHIASLSVIHVNHGLRGSESDGDEAFVAEWCSQNGMPVSTISVDVASWQNSHRIGMEDAARHLRWEAIHREAKRIDASEIAVGHHADDRVETVLLNIFRGCGIDGLAAMPERTGIVVRPCIALTGTHLREYCIENDIPFRIDQTNLDTNVSRRNWVRCDLIARVEERFGYSLTGSLERLRETAAADLDLLESTAESAFNRCVLSLGADQIVFHRNAFSLLHIALQRRILRQAVTQVAGSRVHLGFEHSEQIIARAAAGHETASTTIPGSGLEMRLTADTVSVSKASQVYGFRNRTPTMQHIAVPGTLHWNDMHGTITAELCTISEDLLTAVRRSEHAQTLLPNAVEVSKLCVRNWADGDWVRPFGMQGKRKKLQDVFTDRKITEPVRNQLPVLLVGDETVWVPGVVSSEMCRVEVVNSSAIRLSWCAETGLGSVHHTGGDFNNSMQDSRHA